MTFWDAFGGVGQGIALLLIYGLLPLAACVGLIAWASVTERIWQRVIAVALLALAFWVWIAMLVFVRYAS